MEKIKIDRQIQNPCYNTKTKTDCPQRSAGCRETCNRFKIYKTLKKIEEKQKQKEIDLKNLESDIIENNIKRQMRRANRRHFNNHG